MTQSKIQQHVTLQVQPAVVVSVEGGEPYEGSYEVTPKVEAQVLPTRSKTMQENLTVKSIPYFEEDNSAGGATAYIAAEPGAGTL